LGRGLTAAPARLASGPAARPARATFGWAALLIAVALVAAGCDRGDARGRRAAAPASTAALAEGLAWRQLPAAPTERTEVTAAAVGGEVYLVGGYRRDGATVPTVEVFQPASGRWRRAPDLPVAVNHAMAATVGGAVHVFGGNTAEGKPSAAAFRFADGGWRRLADLPEARVAGTAVAVGGKVYLAGGLGPGGLARAMLVYDPAADRWSVAPGPPTPREHLGGAGADGRVYTVGGRAAGRGNLDAVEVFDPASSRWTSLPPLPTARGGLAAAAADGFVVAVGGEGAATFKEAEAFDLTSGTWRSLPPMPTPRHGLGVVAIGTVLYTLSGGPQPGLHVAATAEALDLAPLRP
jgi:hypothetical protein